MGLFKKALLGAAFAATMTAGSAYAVPITGMISVGGADSYSSTAVTFVPGSGSALAATETGSFTVIGNTFNVTLNSFTYAPALSPSPVTIFSATNTAGTSTASFTLSSITSYSNTANQLAINGLGTLSLTGFDATNGSFQFSTQGPSGATVTFSATAQATGGVVPEPASLMLLGSGLVGLGVLRRRGAK